MLPSIGLAVEDGNLARIFIELAAKLREKGSTCNYFVGGPATHETRLLLHCTIIGGRSGITARPDHEWDQLFRPRHLRALVVGVPNQAKTELEICRSAIRLALPLIVIHPPLKAPLPIEVNRAFATEEWLRAVEPIIEVARW